VTAHTSNFIETGRGKLNKKEELIAYFFYTDGRDLWSIMLRWL
jgi:hypothetical protein